MANDELSKLIQQFPTRTFNDKFAGGTPDAVGGKHNVVVFYKLDNKQLVSRAISDEGINFNTSLSGDPMYKIVSTGIDYVIFDRIAFESFTARDLANKGVKYSGLMSPEFYKEERTEFKSELAQTRSFIEKYKQIESESNIIIEKQRTVEIVGSRNQVETNVFTEFENENERNIMQHAMLGKSEEIYLDKIKKLDVLKRIAGVHYKKEGQPPIHQKFEDSLKHTAKLYEQYGIPQALRGARVVHLIDYLLKIPKGEGADVMQGIMLERGKYEEWSHFGIRQLDKIGSHYASLARSMQLPGEEELEADIMEFESKALAKGYGYLNVKGKFKYYSRGEEVLGMSDIFGEEFKDINLRKLVLAKKKLEIFMKGDPRSPMVHQKIDPKNPKEYTEVEPRDFREAITYSMSGRSEVTSTLGELLESEPYADLPPEFKALMVKLGYLQGAVGSAQFDYERSLVAGKDRTDDEKRSYASLYEPLEGLDKLFQKKYYDAKFQNLPMNERLEIMNANKEREINQLRIKNEMTRRYDPVGRKYIEGIVGMYHDRGKELSWNERIDQTVFGTSEQYQGYLEELGRRSELEESRFANAISKGLADKTQKFTLEELNKTILQDNTRIFMDITRVHTKEQESILTRALGTMTASFGEIDPKTKLSEILISRGGGILKSDKIKLNLSIDEPEILGKARLDLIRGASERDLTPRQFAEKMSSLSQEDLVREGIDEFAWMEKELVDDESRHWKVIDYKNRFARHSYKLTRDEEYRASFIKSLKENPFRTERAIRLKKRIMGGKFELIGSVEDDIEEVEVEESDEQQAYRAVIQALDKVSGTPKDEETVPVKEEITITEETPARPGEGRQVSTPISKQVEGVQDTNRINDLIVKYEALAVRVQRMSDLLVLIQKDTGMNLNPKGI